MAFMHFSHPHPLVLNEKGFKDAKTCNLCKEYCDGPTYTCDDCSGFFLEKSCAELPQEFQSPYHQHPLTLKVYSNYGHKRVCYACHEDIRGLLAFCCEQYCNLHLHVGCALLKLTIDDGQDHLLHFSHFHPLVFKEKNAVDCNCSICGEVISGALYSCEACKFYLHQLCSQLQQKFQHFSHPHPLTCRTKSDAWLINCEACHDEIIRNYYLCKTCSFKIDMSCAVLPSKMESEGVQLFYHPFHRHPFVLGEIKHGDNDGISCAACKKICSGQTYICCSSKCKFLLHQHCFDLPQIIRHPIHPRHPLTLKSERLTDWRCKVCSENDRGFFYYCYNCSFILDLGCLAKISKISMINYHGHHHNLFFAPNCNSLKPDACCLACGTKSQMSSLTLRCFECDIFLHLKCGPLPCTIELEDHMHPLTLTDSPVVAENEDKEGTNQFICDACEKVDRDPRLPVYYCHEGCRYLAELECVISEVIRSMLGEHGTVELKTPIRHVPGKVIGRATFEAIEQQESGQDNQTDDAEASHVEINPTTGWRIFRSLMREEENELLNIIKTSENDLHQDNSEVFSLIINAAKIQLLELHIKMNYLLSCREQYIHECPGLLKEKVVSVGHYLVSLSLASILEDLCAKYGDIGAESALRSSKVKSLFIILLCATINHMYATRVVDISENQLANWWMKVKILQFAGFKVQFAFDHLGRVMHAYNGIQIEVKKNRKELHREIEEVSQTIEKLKAKLELLKERSNFIELEQFSGFEGECLKEASARKWKVAGEGLL